MATMFLAVMSLILIYEASGLFWGSGKEKGEKEATKEHRGKPISFGFHRFPLNTGFTLIFQEKFRFSTPEREGISRTLMLIKTDSSGEIALFQVSSDSSPLEEKGIKVGDSFVCLKVDEKWIILPKEKIFPVESVDQPDRMSSTTAI